MSGFKLRRSYLIEAMARQMLDDWFDSISEEEQNRIFADIKARITDELGKNK